MDQLHHRHRRDQQGLEDQRDLLRHLHQQGRLHRYHHLDQQGLEALQDRLHRRGRLDLLHQLYQLRHLCQQGLVGQRGLAVL